MEIPPTPSSSTTQIPISTTTSTGWYTHPDFTGKAPEKISLLWTTLALFLKFWKGIFVIAVPFIGVGIKLYFVFHVSKALLPTTSHSSINSITAITPQPLPDQVIDGEYNNKLNGFAVAVNTGQYKVVNGGGNCVAITDYNTVDTCDTSILPKMIHTSFGWSLTSYRITTSKNFSSPIPNSNSVLFGTTTGNLYPLSQIRTGEFPLFKQVAVATEGSTTYTIEDFHNYTEPVNQKIKEDDFKRFLAGLRIYGITK